jgi:hypothetical protein
LFHIPYLPAGNANCRQFSRALGNTEQTTNDRKFEIGGGERMGSLAAETRIQGRVE